MHYLAKCHMLDVGATDRLPVFAYPSIERVLTSFRSLETDWNKAAQSYWKSNGFKMDAAASGGLDGGAAYAFNASVTSPQFLESARQLLLLPENPPSGDNLDGCLWKQTWNYAANEEGFVVGFPGGGNGWPVSAQLGITVFPANALFRHRTGVAKIMPNVSVSLIISEQYQMPNTYGFSLGADDAPNEVVCGAVNFCGIMGKCVTQIGTVPYHTCSFNISSQSPFTAWE